MNQARRGRGLGAPLSSEHRALIDRLDVTLSYYDADPDGDNVELQVDCFGHWQKSTSSDGRPRQSAG